MSAEPPGRGRDSIGRTIVVIEDLPYLWAVLRRRIEPATAYVRSARPDELAAVWRTCKPWPWLVVGAAPSAPPILAKLVGDRPIVIHWLGYGPADLPSIPVVHSDWLSLATELDRLNDLASHGLNGVRLLRNRGLRMPTGPVVPNAPCVEGLLAAGGGLEPVAGADVEKLLADVQAEIDNYAIPLRVTRTDDRLRLITV
jgi:hypothetical protein